MHWLQLKCRCETLAYVSGQDFNNASVNCFLLPLTKIIEQQSLQASLKKKKPITNQEKVMLNQHLRPFRRPSEFSGRRHRVIFCGRVVRKSHYHAFSLGQVVQVNVDYIQNLLRLIKDAYPHGVSHLSGSLAAKPTSTIQCLYQAFFKIRPVKLLKTALEILSLFVLQRIS